MTRDITVDDVQTWGEETEPAVQLESMRDFVALAVVEADDTRRQAERSIEGARKYAIAEFAHELLAVADNLQRVLQAAEQRNGANTQDQTLLEGVWSTERSLTSVFARFGIRKNEVLGVRFDRGLHEAIMEIEDKLHPPGTIVRVVEDGYLIHDRLLRPARVIVAKEIVGAAIPCDAFSVEAEPEPAAEGQALGRHSRPSQGEAAATNTLRSE
jgi:molecular chaperone GrpE